MKESTLHILISLCFFNPEEEVRNHNLHNTINSQINSLDLNNEQVCVIVRLQDHPHSGVRTAPALIGQKSPHHHDFRTFFEHYFSIFRQVSPKQKKKTIFPFLRRSILLSTMHFSTKQANKEKSFLKLKPLLYIYFHYHMPWRSRETLVFLCLYM